MLVSAVVVCVLISSTAAVQFCYPQMLYEYTNDFTATHGSGQVNVKPEGSVTSTDGVATFASGGTVEYMNMQAHDWRDENLLAFTFHPNDPSLDLEIGIMTNTMTPDAESLMVSWCGNEVMLTVMLEMWGGPSEQFEIRTEVLKISGLDMNETQSVRVCVEPDQIRFQSSPLIGGGAPAPVSVTFGHGEDIKIIGWEPVILGAGTNISFSGVIDNFAYFTCIPRDAFEPYDEPTTNVPTTEPTTQVTDA